MSSGEQKELMSIFMDTFPMRIRDIYVVHQPWYFTMFWNMVRPFMKTKLTKRVHLLGSRMSELYEAVDPAVLPPAFGGTNIDTYDRYLLEVEDRERRTGRIGGFAIPFSVEDPTGAGGAGAAAAAAATATAPAAALRAASAPPAVADDEPTHVIGDLDDKVTL